MTPESQGGVKLIADLTIFSRGDVLLVRYRDMEAYDQQTGWFLPNDLVRHLEHPRDAVVRIARDTLGLDADIHDLAEIESFTGHDGTWHLVFHYRLPLDVTPTLNVADSIASAEWFRRETLPPASDVAHGGWALDTIRTLSPAFA